MQDHAAVNDSTCEASASISLYNPFVLSDLKTFIRHCAKQNSRQISDKGNADYLVRSDIGAARHHDR